jgi:hypothetical protein
MYSRKTEIYKDLNVLSEKRYINKKFLFEEEDKNETIKLQVTPIQGKVNKYKISYFEKQPNGNLKDVLSDLKFSKVMTEKIKKADRIENTLTRRSFLKDPYSISIK